MRSHWPCYYIHVIRNLSSIVLRNTTGEFREYSFLNLLCPTPWISASGAVPLESYLVKCDLASSLLGPSPLLLRIISSRYLFKDGTEYIFRPYTVLRTGRCHVRRHVLSDSAVSTVNQVPYLHACMYSGTAHYPPSIQESGALVLRRL